MNRENLIAPNSWPVKQEMLRQMKEKKDEAARIDQADSEDEFFEKEDSSDFSETEILKEPEPPSTQKKERVPKKQLYRHYVNVIKNSDIIIEVLDGRDPLGSRSEEVENLIKEIDPNKTIILLINKIDELSRDNIESWLTYFRKQIPTLAFQSAVPKTFNTCLGVTTLLRVIKNFVKNTNKGEETITVGVVGFPNVGKTSVIESIAAQLGTEVNEEGFDITPNIKLLGKPATIIASPDTKKIKGAIRNATDLKFILEPLTPIKFILDSLSKAQVLQLYQIPDYSNHVHFLNLLIAKESESKESQKQKKATIDAVINMARKVFEEWLNGKIPYYTEPPQESPEDISSEWADIYNLQQLIAMEKNSVLDKLQENVKKLMCASEIQPIRVYLHPGWKNIDRDENDPLEDIKEDITRKKQKQGKKKQIKKAQDTNLPRKKAKPSPKPKDDT
jgi:nuclear GTP-binding protein